MEKTMRIAITNLGKYNEGELVFKWLELPASDEEIEKAMEEIGINEEYEEMFISDYECDFMSIGEYDNIDELNEIAGEIEDLADYEFEIVGALLSDGYEIDEAMEKYEDCYYFDDCSDMGEVAYRMYEEGALFGVEIPEALENYIDWDAIGRDLNYEGTWISTDTGYIQVLD